MHILRGTTGRPRAAATRHSTLIRLATCVPSLDMHVRLQRVTIERERETSIMRAARTHCCFETGQLGRSFVGGDSDGFPLSGRLGCKCRGTIHTFCLNAMRISSLCSRGILLWKSSRRHQSQISENERMEEERGTNQLNPGKRCCWRIMAGI